MNNFFYENPKLNKIIFKIINLKKDVEKKKFMKLQCDNIGLNYSFSEAIDGLTYSFKNDIDRYYLKNISESTFNTRKGVLACCISHIQAVKEFVINNDNKDYIVICEDDVIFTDINTEKIIQKIINNSNLEEIGIIYLGLSKLEQPVTEKIFNIDERYNLYVSDRWLYQGAMAYLITKNVAKQILQRYYMGYCRLPIDHFYIEQIKNSYIVYPPLIIHNNIGNSSIDKCGGH